MMQNLALPVEIGQYTIPPGKKQQLDLPVARLPTQTQLSLPITVINGAQPGPRLWLSAAIHGDEINGVEIIRQVLTQLQPKRLRGSLIAVPIVNVFGFIEQSRYLPDRRDLNRSFPGSPRGSLAARLAHLFMHEVVRRCTHGIDLHTASHHRSNWPQIRANLADPETYRCAKAFNAPLMIQSSMRDGSLRQAAAQRGIPVLLYEAGEALRFDPEAIQIGVEGILRVMAILEMLSRETVVSPKPSIEVKETQWARASRSGILHMQVALGEVVQKRQPLGLILDAFGNKSAKIQSPCQGMVIGCTRNPLVNQGDAILHIAKFSNLQRATA
ncbi:succinylglutamate desuccinylase/aspartoacylase family protein [Almyronema epifaneia]|uniref:Succinylglutamate desuccinylase/aspartoacylase family protein n=1 Tax=Almyronema epifaneia S1 TaxID=2991925 RepID=A0ABW6ICF6_9CYAN